MRKCLVICCSMALAATCAVSIAAAPRSRSAARSWQFNVRFHDVQRLSVRLPGDRTETTYWYMLYEVVNDTGRDRQFFPSIQLVTDTLAVVEAGADIHPMVFDVIAGRHKQEFPFLATPGKVMGLALQGEENAKTSAAVFRDFDPEASSFVIYASGFAGAVERVYNPAFDRSQKESDSNKRFFTLRKTLGITYDLPGDPATRNQARPVRRTREWVMR